MKYLFLLIEIGIVLGMIKYVFEIKWKEIRYSIHESNEYLGLKTTNAPKYLIHKHNLILGIEIKLSFIGKEGDSIGFESYGEAKEHLKIIKNN